MHKKFEISRTKIKGDCQSGRKEVTHISKSDLPLVSLDLILFVQLSFLFGIISSASPMSISTFLGKENKYFLMSFFSMALK